MDEPIRNTILKNTRHESIEDVAKVTNVFGNAFIASVFAGSVYSSGVLFNYPELRTTGRMLTQTLIYSGMTAMALRVIAGRARPFIIDEGEFVGAFEFEGFQINEDYQSFPSGHTTVAFGLATILSNRIDNTWASIGLFSLATYVGLNRVYYNHWLSDVILGATLGTATGLFVIRKENNRNAKNQEKNLSWSRFKVQPTLNRIYFTYDVY